MQKPRKSKKNKLQTPLGLLSDSVDMWSAVLCFLFFFDFRGSGHLEQTIVKQSKIRSTLTTTVQVQAGPIGRYRHPK